MLHILPKWMRSCIYLLASFIAAEIFLYAKTFNLSNQPRVSLSMAQIATYSGNHWYYLNGVIFGILIFVSLVFVFEAVSRG